MQFNPKEYRVVALRDCPCPDDLMLCDTPEKAFQYWELHLKSHPYVRSECECLVELLLNTRRRVRGHHLISVGTMDSVLVHAREVFRVAIVGGASSIVLLHNHPGGDPSPSEADIRVTRDLIRAGQLLRIEVVDHLVVGGGGRFVSLKELGYFHS